MTVWKQYPYRNPDLPLETRVNDLVSRFTLDEKINLMCQYQDAVPRLGVPAYKHGTEAAHGMAWLGDATSFPQPIGLACTWDEELMRRIGSVIGDEARGFYRRDPEKNGLTLWAPTVDMERDPRWGRTEEAYGEDPVLTGVLASALIRGLQGEDPFYLKAVASLKHFIGNNNEMDRGSCSVSIDPRNMREYYLKAFEMPFKEGGAQSMMTSYNAVNGLPANMNPDVLRIVKQEWGMNGFVVSDAGDVLGTVNDHKHVETYKEAVAASVLCGIDSITDDHDISKQALRDALADGLLTESDLDAALRNTFRVRMRLGEFDPEERNPYAAIGEEAILRAEHAVLAREAVGKSVVLLKNEAGALPVRSDAVGSAAVVGPLSGIVYRDWYSGTLPYAVTPHQGVQEKLNGKAVRCELGADRVRLKSAATGKYVRLDGEAVLHADLDGAEDAAVFEVTDWGWDNHTLICEANGMYVTTNDEVLSASSEHIWEWFTKEVIHIRRGDDGGAVELSTWNDRPVTLDAASGRLIVVDREQGAAANAGFVLEIVSDGLKAAVEAARAADVAVVCVGNHPLINGKETIDRPDLTLAASQERLIRAVYEANPRTVVVVIGSYPYAIGWVQEHVPAILYVSHAGQELGHGIADVLFGDCSPAGRLNMTWYRSADQLPDFMDYDIIKGDRTYQYFGGDVLYPFGHGLGYSQFAYSGLRVSADRLSADGHVEISLEVANIGEYDNDEVVQLYTRVHGSRVKRPLRQLQGFQRVHVRVGESQTVTFRLDGAALAFWDVTRDRYCVEQGEVALMIGASSADIRLTETIAVEGEIVPPRQLSQVTKAVRYDDYEKVVIDQCADGDCVQSISAGAWIAFRDVAATAGVSSLELRAWCDLAEGATIELRLDAADGPVAGTCMLQPGGLQTRTCALTNVSSADTRSIYVTVPSGVKLVWLRMI